MVTRFAPPNLTTDVGMKLLPVTVMVNWGEATLVDEGEISVRKGAGLPVTVNVTPGEVPPPGAGLITVIVLAPAVVRSEAGMMAVSSVEET